ncbi:MAG TPA: DUF4886 domain-containing protein [Candidatus Methylacidiphilales bacterium]|nr:DUF4886 domain-containing protein [Candidatus Methylacidiphilales bacterium]
MRLLTIGNSLSNNAMNYFPAIAQSAGKSLEYFGANIGGLSLEQHACYLRADEVAAATNPDVEQLPGDGGPYFNVFHPQRSMGTLGTRLLAAIKAAPWDHVTLQQVTPLSYVAESFEPYCSEIIAAIRKYVPGARISVYQTWAFREDFPDFGKLGVDQMGMYHKIKRAYGNVAIQHGLGTVPAGWAYQLARNTPPWLFQFPDSDYDYANPHPDKLPRQTGSLNTGWTWGVNAETGQPTLNPDYRHANSAGMYLAGAVFFESLYGDSAETIPFVPPDLTAAEAESLRAIAHKACVTYQDDGS